MNARGPPAYHAPETQKNRISLRRSSSLGRGQTQRGVLDLGGGFYDSSPWGQKNTVSNNFTVPPLALAMACGVHSESSPLQGTQSSRTLREWMTAGNPTTHDKDDDLYTPSFRYTSTGLRMPVSARH
mmetsp:Transcript_53058/g.124003  ORF Transcript_53058/g.124003 Transcript_53058/m.124003 type:complete len:127 (-) Transcript_53058:33-413(-)